MVVVSHLFSLFRGKFSGDCDLVWSQPPLFWTIYFPTAPFSIVFQQRSFIKVAITEARLLPSKNI